MLGKFINFPVFIISLAIGILFVYLYQPDLTVIYVYPTPDNLNQIQYKDHANNCYSFQQTEVTCPSDSKQIHTIPAQEHELEKTK